MHYQLAQINVARMIGVDIEDPVMREFKDNLDQVNELAESSPGFVWRLKDESNNATSFDPFNERRLIVNVSVWQDVETLEAFTYRTFHSEFIRRRREWFHKFGKAFYALWWIESGAYPTLEQCRDKLEQLQKSGSSQEVFTFKDRFPPPVV